MLERVSLKVASLGGDCYVTFNSAENFYLTGFRSSFGISVVSEKGDSFFITDGRYLERAEKEVRGFKVVKWESWDKLREFLKENGFKRLVVDPDRLKLSTYKELSSVFEIVEEKGFLNEFRAVKTEREISLLTRAVQIAELSLKSVLHLLKPGITEAEFRKELITAFFKFGGEGEAFATIVASGEGSSIPHWETSGREIEDGDVVVVDFGTVYGGYVSDITRTFLIGNVPSEMKRIYEVVREAQEVGIKALSAGKSCREVDEAVRSYIESKGYGEFFVHSTGHGIGVEVHESPTLSRRSNEILKKNMVVTVEPGIYIPELGGVRIEDDCLVLEDGAFVISQLEK